MADTTRWGILGTGNIAKKFAAGLDDADNAELVAVGSRSKATADDFGDAFNVPNRHASYEDLVADGDVDVIYVSSPHQGHKEHTLLCLEAGKAVLCEKPFAINRGEAEAMVEAARSKNLFLMEAMWSRFLPTLTKLRELLAEGAIGEPRLLQADFGFRAGFDPQSRLFNPAYGGGALLDIGVYCVSLAHMVFGAPQEIRSHAVLGETGVDEQNGVVLGYANGALAVLSSTVRTTTPHEAVLCGTEGRIKLAGSWWTGSKLVLQAGGEEKTLDLPPKGNGYTHEAEAVGQALREGSTEHEVMPLDNSLAVMATLDAIRAQWGLKYPME